MFDIGARRSAEDRQNTCKMHWRSGMGVEPTQDRVTALQTVLKTAVVTGPRAAPLASIFARRRLAVTCA